jgi:hypothetical protein
LNDLLKNLANAEACLKNLDLKLTGDHLKVAKWNAEQVKKAIAVVGQAKKPTGAHRSWPPDFAQLKVASNILCK